MLIKPSEALIESPRLTTWKRSAFLEDSPATETSVLLVSARDLTIFRISGASGLREVCHWGMAGF